MGNELIFDSYQGLTMGSRSNQDIRRTSTYTGFYQEMPETLEERIKKTGKTPKQVEPSEALLKKMAELDAQKKKTNTEQNEIMEKAKYILEHKEDFSQEQIQKAKDYFNF